MYDSPYQSTLDAVHVYVVPWSEFPIVFSSPHICSAMDEVPHRPLLHSPPTGGGGGQGQLLIKGGEGLVLTRMSCVNIYVTPIVHVAGADAPCLLPFHLLARARSALQGCLAHKKTPTPLGFFQDPRHRPR